MVEILDSIDRIEAAIEREKTETGPTNWQWIVRQQARIIRMQQEQITALEKRNGQNTQA